MRDKTVRRRRAVLALLVVLSLILITASFGGSGGALHSVQSAALDVLSPIETGASKALTPVHDLINWVDDVDHASGQRDALRKEVAAQSHEIASLYAQLHSRSDAKKFQVLDSALSLDPDSPIAASVVKLPAGPWVNNVTIDAGSGAGVRIDDPVIDPDGVIGTVTAVSPDGAIVTLIDDPSSGVAARDARSREIGLVVPTPGSPGTLWMQDVSRPSEVRVGDLIVTAGLRATGEASFFPGGIPIGTVTSVDLGSDTATVSPAADLTSLQNVQVLTRVPRP